MPYILTETREDAAKHPAWQIERFLGVVLTPFQEDVSAHHAGEREQRGGHNRPDDEGDSGA